MDEGCAGAAIDTADVLDAAVVLAAAGVVDAAVLLDAVVAEELCDADALDVEERAAASVVEDDDGVVAD